MVWSLRKFTKFDHYSKESNIQIEDYVSELEKPTLHNQIWQKEILLFPPVLNFKLLDSANVNHHDLQLALTSADHKNGEFYSNKWKIVLRKFHG